MKYGIQGTGWNYGTREHPIQLFQVVNHDKPNAWGQSQVVSFEPMTQVDAQRAADELNLQAEYVNRPMEDL